MASKGRSPSISDQSRDSDSRRNRRQKGSITRVRTGCFTCRKRKKKCDEQKPTCQNCQKTSVVCEGYPQPEQWENRIAAKRHSVDSAMPIFSVYDYQHPAARGRLTSNFGLSIVEAQGFWNPTLPNYNYMAEPPFGDGLDFIYDQPPSFGMDGMQRLPINVDSFDGLDGFSGQIMARQESINPEEWDGRQYSMSQTNIPSELPFLISGVESAIERRLFCHFTGVTSSLLAMSVKDSNPFNTVVVPLALQDRTVMDVVLSLAGSHLLKLQGGNCENQLVAERTRLHNAAAEVQAHRVQTLKSLPSSVAPACTVKYQDAMFATSLLLCLYEICEGTGNDSWRTHLEMARQVITTVSRGSEIAPASGESPANAETDEIIVTEVNPFLLEFFLYHDSIATVTVPSEQMTRPRIQIPGLSPQCSYMIGVQDGLNDFITRISSLRRQAEASPNEPDGDVVAKAVIIWQDLARWKPEASFSAERQLIAEFYQWALFIWLYSIVYPEGQADEKVQSAVKRVTDGMCNIKSEEGVLSCLLFPLFLVGSAAIGERERQKVSEQFKRLSAWSSLGNIDLTYQVVEKMWKDHDLGRPKSWDWVRQLEMHQMSFLVT